MSNPVQPGSYLRAAFAAVAVSCTLWAAPVSSQATGDAARPVDPPVVPGMTPAPIPADRPRIGLVLSGGGARGFAHVGVLRVLEEMRIPVDCIAGTSAGSAVGAAYATGLSPDEIERALRSADWDRDMFDDAPPRRDQQERRKNEEKSYMLDFTFGMRDGSVMVPPGLISGQKIELFLHRMLRTSAPLGSFDQLPIPFRAIATDLEIGEMVSQDRGSLVTAVRASMAVPSAFAPVESNGRLLVDGGLTRNMPVDVVREMCGDVIIAVDIGGPLMKRDELRSAFGIAGQMIGILMERNMRESREQVRQGHDVMLRPDLGDIGSASFSRGIEGIPAGETATRNAAAELSRLALSQDDYAAWQAARASRVVRNDRYDGVRVVGVEPASARSLLGQAGLPAQGTLDHRRMERTINAWNSTGDFDRIGYALVPDGMGQVLQLEPVERGWGPNYLRFGLGAAADSNNNGVFNVMLGYRRPQITPFGGEFKTELQFGTSTRFNAELFQPVNRGGTRLFVAPRLSSETMPVWIFNNRDRIAEYQVMTSQVGIDVGVQGTLGEARLSGFTGRRDTQARIGSPGLPDEKADFSGAALSLVADQLDATDFARDGYYLGLNLRIEDITNEVGASAVARRGILQGKQVASWGDHTLSASFRVGEADNRVALNQYFTLGGFMNLSGLQINQILGTSLRYANLGYQNQILTLPNPLGRGVYAGVAIEAGEMRGTSIGLRQDGWIPGATAYVGAHTAIGPIYLGYGMARGGNSLVYLFLGRPGL